MSKTNKRRLNEFGGMGYSYGGGSSIFPVNRGGGMNKGGFGGASNLGGPNMMYTYEIKPLNRSLQPDPIGSPELEEIKNGNDISGYELNKRDGILHIGPLLRTVKSENGSLMYYIILDPETATRMKLDPTTSRLISKIDGVDPLNVRLGNDEADAMRAGQIANENFRAKTVNEIFGIKRRPTYEYDDDDYGFEIENVFKKLGFNDNMYQFSYDIVKNRPYIGIRAEGNEYYFKVDIRNDVILDRINDRRINKKLGEINSIDFIENLEKEL